MPMRQQLNVMFYLLSFCLFGLSIGSYIEAQEKKPVDPAPSLKMTARYNIEQGSDKGFLIVKLEIPHGSHIYSLTQQSPLTPSKLVVKPNKQFSAGKAFKSDKKPKVTPNDPLFNARVEKHSGTVQFFVPIKVDASTDLKKLKPEITYSGQMCSDQGFCKQVNNKIAQAEFAGYFERKAKSTLPQTQKK